MFDKWVARRINMFLQQKKNEEHNVHNLSADTNHLKGINNGRHKALFQSV